MILYFASLFNTVAGNSTGETCVAPEHQTKPDMTALNAQ